METRSQNPVQWVMTTQNISQDVNVRTGILAQAIFSWAKAESSPSQTSGHEPARQDSRISVSTGCHRGALSSGAPYNTFTICRSSALTFLRLLLYFVELWTSTNPNVSQNGHTKRNPQGCSS